jgi:hypothetical protein
MSRSTDDRFRSARHGDENGSFNRGRSNTWTGTSIGGIDARAWTHCDWLQWRGSDVPRSLGLGDCFLVPGDRCSDDDGRIGIDRRQRESARRYVGDRTGRTRS